MTQIKKIEHIRSIGNYEDYTAHGDVTLKKFNFIYAENGAGKTTLAAILHSLSNNDSSIIEHHRRLNAASDPVVEIRLDDNSQCRFDDGHWNRNVSDIEVFDSNFVASNVFTGMDIKLDNRRSLYKFVLGNEGIKISQKIARAKELIDVSNAEIDGLSARIMSQSGGKRIEEVAGLQQIPDIDKQITDKERERKIALNAEPIKTFQAVPIIQPFSFHLDINAIKQILSCTIETISQEYVDKVTRHVKELAEHGLRDAQRWINDGLNAISDEDNCPFCGQPLNGAGETIESYRQFFNKVYNELVEQIRTIKAQIASIKALDTVKNINDIYSKLFNQYIFWKNYLKTIQPPQSIPAECRQFVEAVDNLRRLIDEKQASPLTSQKYDEQPLFHIIETISNYTSTLTGYASQLKSETDALRNAKKDVKTVDEELAGLVLAKKRFEEPLNSLCKRYNILLGRIKILQRINENLQSQQKRESIEFLNNYGNRINHYLRDVFGTDFLIEQIKGGGYRGRAKETSLDYQLTFRGQSLLLEADGNLSVKSSLSEGDKNTIAFCIFLAKLDSYDDELQNKIVVFDDPLTSLDLNRCNSTINQLVLLYHRTSQIIVLSHNLSFLVELYGNRSITKADKKSLQIVHEINKSSIKEFVFKDKAAADFAECIRSMDAFRVNPIDENREPAIRSIRLSLESYLKFKYGRFLSSMDLEFGKVIHELETKPECKFVPNTNKEEVINALNNLNNISWRAHHATVEESQYMNETHITNDELERVYIPMAFDLLFGKL